jgi:hypothetical protein
LDDLILFSELIQLLLDGDGLGRHLSERIRKLAALTDMSVQCDIEGESPSAMLTNMLTYWVFDLWLTRGLPLLVHLEPTGELESLSALNAGSITHCAALSYVWRADCLIHILYCFFNGFTTEQYTILL